jgi:hypothetical protein
LGSLESWFRTAERSGDDQCFDKRGYLTWLWLRLDERYSERADYQLWRVLERPRVATRLSEGWRCQGLVALAIVALNNKEPKVQWGAVSLAPRLLVGEKAKELARTDLQGRSHLIGTCEKLLPYIVPAEGHGAECGLLEFLLRGALQSSRYEEAGTPMEVAHVPVYLLALKRAINKADRHWTPGDCIDTSTLNAERRCHGGNLLSAIRVEELTLKLHQVLYRARAVAVKAVEASGRLGEDERKLLDEAWRFALSAWRVVRATRLGLQRTGHEHRERKKQLEAEEARALWQVSGAASDRGDQYAARKFLCILQHVVPDELLHKEPFKSLGNKTSRWIRQLGLRVDPRFKMRAEDNKPRTEQYIASLISALAEEESQDQGEGAQGGQGSPTVPATFLPGSREDKTTTHPLFRKRVAYDRSEEPSLKHWWGKVLAECVDTPRDPLGPLQVLLDRAERGGCDQPPLEALRSALNLSLHYGLIEQARSFLRAIRKRSGIQKEDVVNFAHSVKRAAQALPFALDGKSHETWRRALRKGWAAILGTAGYDQWYVLGAASAPSGICANDAMVVHEMRLGRGITLSTGLAPDQAGHLVHRHYDALEEDEVRDLLDTGAIAFSSKGPATVLPDRVEQWLQTTPSQGERRLGSPVCVSIIELDQDRLGVLMHAKGSGWDYCVLHCPEWKAATEEVAGACGDLAKRPQNGSQDHPMPWGSLQGLAESIVSHAESLDERSRWLLVGVEPELARLPWQRFIGDWGGGDYVVSIVPSFSWAVMTGERRGRRSRRPPSGMKTEPVGASCPATHRGIDLRLSSAPDLRPLCCRIEGDRHKLENCLGTRTSIVCGHGTCSGEHCYLPSVSLGQSSLSLDNWIEVADSRLCLVHSCFGGTASPMFFGDFGGIPGIVLRFECRLVAAPVSEVSTQTAEAFHDALTQGNGSSTIGERYLEAAKKDPRVSLYNLYGFANEWLLPGAPPPLDLPPV